MSKGSENPGLIARDIAAAFVSLPLASIVLQETKVIACNSLFLSLVHRSDEATVTGKSVRSLLTRDSLKKLQEALAADDPTAQPLLLSLQDGESGELPVYVWFRPLQSGESRQYLLQFVEAGGHLRQVKQLKEGEQRLQNLFRCSTVAIAIVREGQIVEWNPAFAALLRYDEAGSLEGMVYESLISETDRTSVSGQIKKFLKKKSAGETLRYSLTSKDGVDVPVSAHVSRLDGGGPDELILQHQEASTIAGLEAELKRDRIESGLLAKFISQTSASSTLEEIAGSALSVLMEVLGMEAGAVYLLEQARGEYQLALQRNLPAEVIEKIANPPVDEGIGGYLSKTLEAHVYPISRYPSYLPHRALFKAHGYATVGFVPHVIGGICRGFVLAVSKRTIERIPSAAFFTTLSHELGKTIEAARTFGRITHAENETRTLIESVGDVLYRAAPDGSFHYLSPRIESLAGYEANEFFRNKALWLGLVHRDDKKFLLERSANLESLGDRTSCEYRILPKGKAAYRWVRDTATILRNENGSARVITGTLSDITSYKSLAEELVRTNELNNSIIGSVHEGVIVVNSTQRCIQWNDAMERITGLQREEVLGKPVTEIIQSGGEDLSAILARAIGGETVNTDETVYNIAQTGKEIVLWGRYSPLRDIQGDILGAVGILSDLTERKSLERELKESEQVLRNVIDTMGDILMITDLKGNVLEVNRSFLNVLGYTRLEIITHEFPYPWLIEEEMGRYVLWIGTLREKNWLHDFDMTWRSKDGRLIPISLSTTLLRNSLGEPIAMVNIARDITERKHLMQDLETRKNQVEMLNRIITAANQSMDFASIFPKIAEEIRNLIPYDDIFVSLLEEGAQFRVIASLGSTEELRGLTYPAGNSASGQALNDGMPVVANDLEQPDQRGLPAALCGFRSLITLPIMVEKRSIGAMNILSKTPGAFTDQHLSVLQSIASQTGAILDRILLFNKVSEDASYIHNLLDSIDSVVYTVDTQYRILEVNKAWYEFIHETGAPVLENYHGMSIFDALPEESMKLLFQTVGSDVLSGVIRFFSQEFTHPTPLGNRIYQVTMNPMIIDRKITGLVISHSDITALKDSEVALKKNNEQLVALNEISTLFSSTRSIGDVLAITLPLLLKTLEADAATVFLTNRSTNRLEMVQQRGFPADAEQSLNAMVSQGAATGMVIGTEEPLFIPGNLETSKDLLPQNREFLRRQGICSMAVLPLRSKDVVLGALDIFYRSPHQFIEQERQLLNLLGRELGTALDNVQLYDELRFQVERLGVLYEFSEHLTSKLDPAQIYEVVVDHVARVIPFDEFSIELVRPGGQQYVQAYRVVRDGERYTVQQVETGVQQFGPESPEVQVIDTKRSYHDEEYTVLHVPMSSKESMIGLMSIRNNRTSGYSETHLQLLESIGNLTAIALEKGKLYEETIQKSEEIERRNRELDDFTYVVSHDLKEPLISIEGFSKILQIDYRDVLKGEGKEYLDSITGASVRMKALIDDLLMLSRVTRPAESSKSFSVAKVIEDIKTDMEYTIRQRNVRFIVPDDLPWITGNATHIKIVFRNLIGNALKFNRSPQPVVEIGFQNRENISYLFSVTDNGIGIDPDFHEKIFVIFQRLHRREEYEGTGAGLAIVKKIIEMHSGRIWVESAPGKGSTFYFTIPQTAP